MFFPLFTAALAEEAQARAERFDGLVESLNATSERRSRVVEQIVGELRGPDGREMHALLLETLSRNNTLVLQGAVEALASLGDAADIDHLAALLATSDKLEVRNLVIRLLPAFCLGGSERARLAYIHYASGYEKVAPPGVLDPLRRPPLTRRGRMDLRLEGVQSRVAAILAAQFDPVAAALPYVEHRLYGPAARNAVDHFVANGLGNNPSLWAGLWERLGGTMEHVFPDEVEEIRLNALLSLSDMAAEGLPEVLAAFDRLLGGGAEGLLVQAALETLAAMCSSSYDILASAAEVTVASQDEAMWGNWVRRRRISTEATALFAFNAAAPRLAGGDEEAIAAAACLGAALSFPPDFPDADGRLTAARAAGLADFERALLQPGISRERRAAVAAALGRIGAERSVSALASILASPYCSPERGQDGARMAEAAVDGLRAAAVGVGDGQASARRELLALLGDTRLFPPLRAGAPPLGLAHMALWRVQTLARSTEISFDPEFWRSRLGW